MNTERVKVLHVAHRNAVVVGVPDDLVLQLLPALERLLDQDLRRQRQGASGHVPELLLVVCEARAQTAQCVRGTHDNGVSDLVRSVQCFLDGVDGDRLGDGDVDLVQRPGEEVTVLADFQGPHTGSQDLDAVFLKDAHFLHLDSQVQGGLSTEGQEDAVWAFALDNVGDIFRCNGDWRSAQSAIGPWRLYVEV